MKQFTRRLLAVLLLIITGLAGWRFAQPSHDSQVIEAPRVLAKKSRVTPPQTPAPRVESLPPAKAPDDSIPAKPSGPLARLMQNVDLAKLTPAQLQTYLAQNQCNAESLMAAFRLTDDLALLREAAAKFPNDPAVQLEVAFRSGVTAERRQAIDALRQSDPANALGDYLSALDHLRAGRSEQAFADMIAGAAKGRLDDFALQAQQATEEAYMAAGFTPVEAKAAAMISLKRQQIEPLRDLSKQLAAIQKGYAQAGDTASADSLRQMGLALGTQMQQNAAYFIDELVGISIEKQHLNPTTGAARLTEIKQRTDYIRQLAGSQTFMQMDGSEAITFFDRMKVYGEEDAYRWLRTRHREK